jgi:hypothetical protein
MERGCTIQLGHVLGLTLISMSANHGVAPQTDGNLGLTIFLRFTY